LRNWELLFEGPLKAEILKDLPRIFLIYKDKQVQKTAVKTAVEYQLGDDREIDQESDGLTE